MTSSLSLINQDLGLILAILKKKKKRVEKKDGRQLLVAFAIVG